MAIESVEPACEQHFSQKVGETLDVRANIRTGALTPDDLLVELYHGPLGAEGKVERSVCTRMQPENSSDGVITFQAKITFRHSGRYGFAVRILPYHASLVHPYDGKCVLWG